MASPSWVLTFVPYGERVDPPLPPGTVALDVGNEAPEAGVLDHHRGDDGAASTTELVFRHRDLIHQQLDGEDEIEVITHEHPDFDALTAFFLTWLLGSSGRHEGFQSCSPLVDFASAVDQGRIRPDETLTLYTFVLMISPWLTTEEGLSFRESKHMGTLFQEARMINNDPAPDVCAVTLALRLFRDWHGASDWEPSAPIPRTHVSQSIQPVLSPLSKRLHRQVHRCYQDLNRAQSVGETGWMTAPRRSASPVDVPYVRIVDPDANPSILGKYLRNWSRQEHGTPVVSVLQFREAQRTVVSVPPESRLTLKGLGLHLEQLEQDTRSSTAQGDSDPPRYQHTNEDGTVHVDPLFSGSDPWYDGRGHNFTIVDAPREGSSLSLDRVFRAVVEDEWIGKAERYESPSYKTWKAIQESK